MKDFLKNSIGKLAINIVVFLIVWPLGDYLWSSLIVHEPFKYTVANHIAQPAVFAVVVTVLDYFYWKRKNK